MEQPYPVHKVELNTPQGLELIESIKSQLKVDLVINSNQSMSLDLRVDKDHVFETIKHFLTVTLKPPVLQSGNNTVKSLEIIPRYTECDETYAKTAYSLTPRQLEIMELVADSKSNIEIAKLLELSFQTVKSHMRHIFKRYDVTKRLDAIKKYLKEKERNNDSTSSDFLLAMTKLGYLDGMN